MTATPLIKGLRRPVAACALALAGFALQGAGIAQAEMARVLDPGLMPYTIVDAQIPKSLTGQPGDAARGKAVFVNRRKGNCLSCHTAPIPEEDFHGQIGPDLAGVGSRLNEGEMRLRLVDAKAILPDSLMPSFYRTGGLRQVKKGFEGKPILEPQEIEDVIAYLKTLK